jgi:hypothetical protein
MALVNVIPQTVWMKRKLKALNPRDVAIPEMLKKGWGLCPMKDHWVQEVGVNADTGAVVGCKTCVTGRSTK